MILIDTSAWIEFLRRRGDETASARVAECLRGNRAAYTCPIVFELHAGARTERERETVRDLLGLCRRVVLERGLWDLAGEAESDMVAQGLKVPRFDLLVALAAVHARMPLLTRDQHFETIRDAVLKSLKVELV